MEPKQPQDNPPTPDIQTPPAPTAQTTEQAQPQQQAPVVATPPPVQTPQPSSPPPANGGRKPPSKKLILIGGGVGIFVISIVLALVAVTLSKNNSNKDQVKVSQAPTPKQEQVTPTPVDKTAPSQLMLYGTWTGQTSVVRAVNLRSLENFQVATLPLAVKNISFLSAQNLLFVDQIDTSDRGRRITVFNIKDKLATLSIPASSGYAIDSYVLSPDKKFIALWEVQLAAKKTTFESAKSRIFAIDLSRHTVKNLLYDEQASPTQPLHYPRAILNDGTVFADTIVPNDPKVTGNQWGNGMSVVDFDGTNKRDIETMKAGTYGTKPSLSPDGKYMVFAGYTGPDGQTVVNGIRKATLYPNTVEVLNTQSLKRFVLPDAPSGLVFTSAAWEAETGHVIMTARNQTGADIYSYDLSTQIPTKIALPTNVAKYTYLSQVSETKALIGSQDLESNIGNLGEDYSYPYTQLALLDIPAQKATFFSLQDPFAQYITLLPINYFKAVLGK